MGILTLRVASPAANFRKHQLHENGQAAFVYGIGHQAPLVVGQVTTSGLHPHSFGTKSGLTSLELRKQVHKVCDVLL